MREGSHPWACSWAQKALNITGHGKACGGSAAMGLISSPVSSWRPLLLLWPSRLGPGVSKRSATFFLFCFFFSHRYQFSLFSSTCFLWGLSFCTSYRLDRSKVHIPHDQVSAWLVPTQHRAASRASHIAGHVPTPVTVSGSGSISDPFNCSQVSGPWVTKDSRWRLQKGFSANSSHR